MSLIIALLSACMDYGLTSKQDDTAVDFPGPVSEEDSVAEDTSIPEENIATDDTGSVYIPPEPPSSFAIALPTCFNITANACPINNSTGGLDSSCTTIIRSHDELIAKVEELIPDPYTYEDVLAGSLPITGMAYYYDHSSDGDNIQTSEFEGGFIFAIGDHYDDVIASGGAVWPVGTIECEGAQRYSNSSTWEGWEQDWIRTQNFVDMDPTDDTFEPIDFDVTVFGNQIVHEMNSPTDDVTNYILVNQDYYDSWPDGYYETQSGDPSLDPEGLDFTTSITEVEATSQQIIDMAYSYMSGDQGSKIFLDQPN